MEWQISYDVEIKNEGFKDTTLPEKLFVAANGKKKAFYELSEYLYYFHSWSFVTNTELKSIFEFLSDLREEDLISNHEDCEIKRTHPVEKRINNLQFFGLTLEYPQLLYRYGKYAIEITIREKQRAVGVQPMLYLCVPIIEIQARTDLIGRLSEKNERGKFLFDSKNHRVIVEMIKIFGMLSPSHNKDIVEIIETTMRD